MRLEVTFRKLTIKVVKNVDLKMKIRNQSDTECQQVHCMVDLFIHMF